MNAHNNNNQKIHHKIKSGTMMQGICMQWFIDTYGFSNNGKVNGFEMYCAILRKTFGYRQRSNYISADYFQMSPNKMKRHRDYLVQLGLIEWKKTKQMTYYKILEPSSEINNFIFISKSKLEDNNVKDIEEQEKQEKIDRIKNMTNEEFNKYPAPYRKNVEKYRNDNTKQLTAEEEFNMLL
jgi:hypothetical protein